MQQRQTATVNALTAELAQSLQAYKWREWRRDGKAIFYWASDHTFMEAQVETSRTTLQVIASHPLFKASMYIDPAGSAGYDVTPDGKRFIVNTSSTGEDQPLTIVTNWTANLKR